ncbi:MAG: 50S ribosomal protein L11 methyltransferase [Verrucomicrobiota bacterium]
MRAKTKTPLWRILARVTASQEEAVADLFELEFGAPPCIYTDADTGAVTIFHYCDTEQTFVATKAATLAGRCQTAGVTPLPEIFLETVKREDWAESWKKHFKPIRIGHALLVKPEWSTAQPVHGQAVMLLDPGLSFGTGQHATTRFCLQQLAASRRKGTRQSFWDAGTGSGILAIAAAKLGYSPITAIDFDPMAVKSARANARRNHVTGQLKLACADLTKIPLHSRIQYDVVCANLMYDLLLAEKERILNRLKPDGHLVLAGILHHQFPAVQQAYEASGLRLVSSRTVKEWRSGMFVRLAKTA